MFHSSSSLALCAKRSIKLSAQAHEEENEANFLETGLGETRDVTINLYGWSDFFLPSYISPSNSRSATFRIDLGYLEEPEKEISVSCCVIGNSGHT